MARRRSRRSRGPAPVSFASLALAVVSAAVLCLALTAAAVALLPLAPAGRALVLLGGLVLTVAAMGVASNRMTARAIREEYGDDDEDAAGTEGRPGPADGLG